MLRVAVLGSLASVDLGLAETLTEAGVDATVLRHVAERDRGDLDPVIFPQLTPGALVHFENSLDLARRLRGFDFVYTYTAQLGFALGRFLAPYPLLRRAGWPAYMNIGTGSDIMERAIEDSPGGRIQRRTMRAAMVNVIPAYPAAIRAASTLRLDNVATLPFPHRPLPESARRLADSAAVPGTRGELRILHATHFDWGEADAGAARTSTKGNDRFLRALARFVNESGRNVRIVLLDRGSDRHAARRLVAELGLDPHVEWRQEMRHDELYRVMADADLVVDQFDVGAMGGIGWETVTMGRPLLTYLASATASLIHDELPPILNARTEAEITARLHEAAEPGALAGIAEATQRWAAPRTAAALAPRYLAYAVLATGRGLETLDVAGQVDAA